MVDNIKLELVVNNKAITGFTGIQVVRAIDACADAFSFTMPWEPTPANIAWLSPFNPTIGNVWAIINELKREEIIRGYCELLEPEISPDSRTLNIQGRSTSGVFLDWSAGPPFQLGAEAGLSLNAVAARIGLPGSIYYLGPDFNLPPDKNVFPGKVNLLEISQGDSVYDVLSRLAAVNGLWAHPQPTGALWFRTFPKWRQAVADLEEGKGGYISGRAKYDMTKRFQFYTVLAGESYDPGRSAEVPDFQTLGYAIRRRLTQEVGCETENPFKAAQFLRSKALVDSYSVIAEVQGWTRGGSIWQAGDIVTLYAPSIFVMRKTRLIASRVTLKLDESTGYSTAIELTFPEAYDVDSSPDPAALPWLPV